MAVTHETIGTKSETTATRRLLDALGLVCLLAALVLLSSGVRIARAEDPASVPTTDAALAAEIETAMQERTRAVLDADGQLTRSPLEPGVAGVEVAPGVVRLNTRGYNYRAASDRPAPPPDRPRATPSAPTRPAAPTPSAE